MRISQFAEEFAARTDSGTSDCPPGEAGSCSSRRRDPLNPKVVRYRFARYTRQRRKRFGTRFCKDWSFLVTADRQTGQIYNYQAKTQFYKPSIQRKKQVLDSPLAFNSALSGPAERLSEMRSL